MDHPRVARLMDVYESEGRLRGELFTRVMDREVKKLLVVEAADRMSAEEALAHRWIQVTVITFALKHSGGTSKLAKTGSLRAQVVDAFLELDTSRRGTIRLHELRDVLSRFDIPDQAPLPLGVQLVPGRHGSAQSRDFPEFASPEESAEIFHALDGGNCDEDGKGFISRESLTKLLGDGDAEVDELLKEVDAKATGRVQPGGDSW
eukprot:Skav234022  [mRNA]  locus=scaffold2538:245642:251989:- [translate_table: standard]